MTYVTNECQHIAARQYESAFKDVFGFVVLCPKRNHVATISVRYFTEQPSKMLVHVQCPNVPVCGGIQEFKSIKNALKQLEEQLDRANFDVLPGASNAPIVHAIDKFWQIVRESTVDKTLVEALTERGFAVIRGV